MTAVLLALGASLAWGVADFVGPWQARTWGTLRVLLWAQIGGLAAIGLQYTRPCLHLNPAIANE